MTNEKLNQSATTEPGTTDSPQREVLTEIVLQTFRLNGMFLRAADDLARPAGLTAAWWQVLGAVLRDPLPVSGIAREMGLARQSVQRVADLLVEDSLAQYQTNPAHARSKLLLPTAKGRHAIGLLRDSTVQWARSVAAVVGEAELQSMLTVMIRLAGVVNEIKVPGDAPEPASPGENQ